MGAGKLSRLFLILQSNLHIFSMKNVLKTTANSALGVFGLRIARKLPEPKYWGTGKLSPIEENSREIYEKFYGDRAALEAYYVGDRMAFFKEVVSQCQQHGLQLDGRSVIDVGCGVGYLLQEIGNVYKPATCTGTDFSEEAMAASRERFPSYKFHRHDILHPLPGTFDVIFCTEVLEHIVEPWIALGNLKKALNPGGALVLTVPQGRKDHSNEHINFWSPESWKAFLERECPEAKSVVTKVIEDVFNFAVIQF